MFSWTSLLSQPMCKIKCSLWKVICDNISIWNLEWLLWVLSTNLCILETLNFLNWGILLSSYYQLPNMYCIRMREESAVFKFIYREFSTKWHTCIYCDSICHSFNENLDWNTNCETFIYNIKPRTTSNKHLFLSALSLSICSALLCVVLHAVQTPRNSVFNEWQVIRCWFLAGQSLLSN